jgi:hypothetical protein
MLSLKTVAIMSAFTALAPVALSAQARGSMPVTAHVEDMGDTRANLAAAYDVAREVTIGERTGSGETRRDTTTATILAQNIASGSDSRRNAAALTIIYW